jgi:hypothetical protein
MSGASFEASQLREFRAALQGDRALCERIIATLPPASPEPEHVIIKTDAASVDAAICKAVALAVEGVEGRLELTTQ